MKRTSILAIGALLLTACPLALDGFTIGDPNADAGGGPDGGADARFDAFQPDTSKTPDTSVDGTTIVDAKAETGVDSSAVCDLTQDPKDSIACVNDTDGVFVDTAGNDANNGKMATPVATLTKGLVVAKTRGIGRIYVCEGTYPEDVVVDSAHDGISIYGGFKCGAWTYSGIKPIVGKTQNPFKLDTLVKSVIIEDIETSGKDGDVNTPSSIGMFVNASTDVTLKRVKLIAGKGFNGAKSTVASNYAKISQNDITIRGMSAIGKVGGPTHACMLCTDAKNSSGGGGGNAGGGVGSPGIDGTPNLNGAFPNDGKGGLGDIGNGCTAGDQGAGGGTGTSATTPVSLGTFDQTGWTGAPGLGGTNGGPGQGGGGGGGDQTGNNSGGGAGAGCGGCGGGSGGGGLSAGSSIALGIVGSTVNVITSELVALDGGAGGAGAGGQGGELGGFSGQFNGAGCIAGIGGSGGAGGAGAGAAGGLSVGVLWKGAGAPTLDANTQSKVTFGLRGTKGVGGIPGTNDGPDGVAQAVLQAL